MLAQLNRTQPNHSITRHDHKNWQARTEHSNDRYDRGDHSQHSQDQDKLRKAAQGHVNKNEAPHNVGGVMVRDFPNREGYQADFLGVNLPLPELEGDLAAQAAPLKDGSHELKYTHFSVIQHMERRSPLLTAVNIDGAQYAEHERDGKWVFDSRIDRKYQLGNEAYSNNSIDRGHMVRRRDPMWPGRHFRLHQRRSAARRPQPEELAGPGKPRAQRRRRRPQESLGLHRTGLAGRRPPL